MDISALINKLVLLFFTMLAGFVAAKAGVLTKQTNKALSDVVVNVTNPLQILASVMTGQRLLSNMQVLELTGISLAGFALTIGLGMLFVRLICAPGKDARVYQYMMVFSNTGYLGYPLAQALLGRDAVFCVSIFVLCFQLVCWTYGVYLMSDEKKFRLSWRVLCRPCVAAALAAYIIYLSGLNIPARVGDALSFVGDITGVLAMLIVGISLAQLNLKHVFGNWRVYALCAVKMVLVPLLAWVLLHRVLNSTLMLSVTTLVLAMPIATNTTIFCYQFGANEEVASSGVFVSTLLSIVSIPLVLTILFAA